MPNPNDINIESFETAQKLSEWLKGNHASSTELWVKVFKKGSGVLSVSWNEIVAETLCWGWIDGVKKSLGDEAYLQRITPRKARSQWSKRNTEHVERLISEGRMQEPGLVHIRAAKADGRWENAYAPASEMKVPDDFLAALGRLPKSKQYYDTLSKSSRYAIAYGLETAKKPETRVRRLKKFLDMLARHEEPGFGFKKKKA
jgi:uncharacterized protein YdeI (YjbR/CyaY-like superfamily)